MISVVAAVLVLLGAAFTMLAGIGTLRLRDVFSRIHPAAKGPTLGLLLVATGAALELRQAGAALTLGLVVVLQFLAAPVGAHLLGRAIHERLPQGVGGDDRADVIDELADDLACRRSGEAGSVPGANPPPAP